MPKNTALRSVHPSGEAGEEGLIESGARAVDTFGGKVFVRWDPDAHVTGFGPVASLGLKLAGKHSGWLPLLDLYVQSPGSRLAAPLSRRVEGVKRVFQYLSCRA